MSFQDRQLMCRDCGKSFVWTAGEQSFYAEKGFSHPPSRCKEHRFKHKAQVQGSRNDSPHQKKYDIICTNCQKAGTVPFEPSTKSALLCAECFVAQRTAKAPREKAPVIVDNATKV